MTRQQTKKTLGSTSRTENVRTGLSVSALRQAFRDNLYCMQVRDASTVTLDEYGAERTRQYRAE